MRGPTCPKCGNWTIARYESSIDMLRHICSCGFSWTTLPRDATPERKKQHDNTQRFVEALKCAWREKTAHD